MANTTLTAQDIVNTLTLHHSAWKRGYISRKERFVIKPYNGRFGTGYTVEQPSVISTQYHTVMYFVK